MLQPLNVSVHTADHDNETPRSSSRCAPKVSAKRAANIAWVITVLTWLHIIAKGFARLFESGIKGDGDGAGLLPLDGTTPPEVQFWVCMTVALVCSELGRQAFGRLAASAQPKGKGGDEGGGSTSSSSTRTRASSSTANAEDAAAEEAAKAAEGAKKAYIKATEPSSVRSIRTMMRMTKPDLPLLAFAYVSLILAALGESFIPFLYGRVIDAIAINPNAPGNMENFRNYMLALIGTALGTGIFTGFRGSTFIVVGGRFGKRLRVRLFESLLKQELDFFGATKTGDVTSRLSSDCQKVSDQVQLNVNVMLRSVIQIFFTLGFMFYINPRLAFACFVIVPAIVIISKVFGDYMRDLSKETQDALAEANSTAEEVISSVSTTRAFAAEAEELKRYDNGLSKYMSCVWRQARLYYFYSSSTFTFLPYLSYCIILFFAAQLIHTPEGCVQKAAAGGDACPNPPPMPMLPPLPPNAPPPAHEPPICSLDGASLVSFIFYTQSLFAAFQSLGSIYTALAQAVGAADQVVKWIERPPTIAPPSEPLTPSSCLGDIKLVDVSFSYALRPQKQVLHGLNLHAAPGEVVALCGPSGGGKSSIIALIERFYTPSAGRVLLDDLPLERLDPRWVHRQVALVGQEPTLFARSLNTNICYGLEGSGSMPSTEEVTRAATLANAHDFVTSFEHGYDTMVGERGTQLSGGQKQRIAIARALVRKPAVLLLDEATSALDAESEHVVQSAIDAMIEKSSMTVLLIAHRLSTVRDANRILVIKHGKVAESGTHNELLGKGPDGEYAKLVHRQMASRSGGSLDNLAALAGGGGSGAPPAPA